MHSGTESFKNLITFAYSYFSIPLLLNTLFHPFQNDKPSKNFDILEIIVFAIFSRILGFAMRIVLIIIGLIFTILILFTFPLFLIFPIKINKENLIDLGSIGYQLSYGNTFHLNKYSKEISSLNGVKLFGKDKALRMVERSLNKDKNRNVLLVGENGVGKSTIISYLGHLGKSGLSSSGIAHHRVLHFIPENISEDEFYKSMEEARSSGNVILCIENVDNYNNIFDKFIPYLNNPNLGIFATVDFSNHDKILKNYPEFLSKFEKIDIFEPAMEDLLLILKNYIFINKISIEEEALEELINLSNRYITNIAQPLKSISILEELSSLQKVITTEDVREVISDRTNINVKDLSLNEKQVLLNLENKMKDKIIGQREAISDLSEALKRLRSGISDPNKPASFLFLGPTGVGKSYTAKILAENYFGSKKAMVRFDMSEFSQANSLPVFIDRITAVIEELPLSLVFLDELEKANRAIHQLLLQLLDEGRLTRESGREANFKNAIIIATSNAESKTIIDNPNIDKKILINNLIDSNTFSPEFLNRWTDIVLFKGLTEEEIREVAKLLLQEFKNRLYEEKEITLEITDLLIDKVASTGFDPLFGARPIHRAIEDIVENKVADFIIEGRQEKVIKII